MRGATLLLLIPLQAGAIRSPCDRAPLSTEASAFAWSDHSQVAYPSSEWLDQIDSLDVCLTFDDVHHLRVVRLPRINVVQTS